jgi:uncharacterized protein (DUF1778 family)
MPQTDTCSVRIESRMGTDASVAVRYAAARAIEDAQIIPLSLAGQEQVAAILEASPNPSAGLDRAKKAHAALIQTGG